MHPVPIFSLNCRPLKWSERDVFIMWYSCWWQTLQSVHKTGVDLIKTFALIYWCQNLEVLLHTFRIEHIRSPKRLRKSFDICKINACFVTQGTFIKNKLFEMYYENGVGSSLPHVITNKLTRKKAQSYKRHNVFISLHQKYEWSLNDRIRQAFSNDTDLLILTMRKP